MTIRELGWTDRIHDTGPIKGSIDWATKAETLTSPAALRCAFLRVASRWYAQFPPSRWFQFGAMFSVFLEFNFRRWSWNQQDDLYAWFCLEDASSNPGAKSAEDLLKMKIMEQVRDRELM